MKKCLTLLMVLTWATGAAAEVPDLIRYQGQLADAQGAPLDGPYDLTFRLYGAASGGAALWTELHEAVALSSGQFSVLLGSVTSLADEDWSQPRWLSIQVDAEPELAPRQQITSVPLAVRAGTAETLANPVTTSNITDDAHALVPAGAVILWTGTACPTGYTRLSALDGRFLVGSSTYQAIAGGTDNKDLRHTHNTPGHDHGGATGSGGNVTAGKGQVDHESNMHPHTHSIPMQASMTTGNPNIDMSAIDIRPAFANVLLCQRN